MLKSLHRIISILSIFSVYDVTMFVNNSSSVHTSFDTNMADTTTASTFPIRCHKCFSDGKLRSYVSSFHTQAVFCLLTQTWLGSTTESDQHLSSDSFKSQTFTRTTKLSSVKKAHLIIYFITKFIQNVQHEIGV
jgi:hypothetical protein